LPSDKCSSKGQKRRSDRHREGHVTTQVEIDVDTS
jgi:hypothetical protein